MSTIVSSQPSLLWTKPLRYVQAVLAGFVFFLSAQFLDGLIGIWPSYTAALLLAFGLNAAVHWLTRRSKARADALSRRAPATPEGLALVGVFLLEGAVLLLLAGAEFAPYSPLDLPRRAMGYQSTLAMERPSVGFSYSSDGQRVLAKDDGLLMFWSLSEPNQVRQIPIADPYLTRAQLSPDGEVAALLRGDQRLQLIRTSDGALLHTIPRVSNGSQIRFSADSTLLATVTSTDPVQVWRVADGRLLQTVPHEYGTSFAGFRPDNTLITHTLDGFWGTYFETAFSSDGRLRAVGGEDGSISLVDMASGQTLRTLKGHHTNIQALAFSPDGILLASSAQGKDESVRVWRVADGQQVALYLTPTKAYALVFAPDNRTLAASEYKRISFWRVPEQR